MNEPSDGYVLVKGYNTNSKKILLGKRKAIARIFYILYTQMKNNNG